MADPLAELRVMGGVAHRGGLTTLDVERAVRVGACSALTSIHELNRRLRLDTGQLHALVDDFFVRTGEVRDAVVEGYRSNESAVQGVRDCRDLVDVLLSDNPSTEQVRSAARAANWQLPRAVVVIAAPDLPRPVPSDMARSILVGEHLDVPCLIAPADDSVLDRVDAALAGHKAAMSPPVRVEVAAPAYRLARRTLELFAAGAAMGTRSVIRCTDHLDQLQVLADVRVLAELSRPLSAMLEDVDGVRRAKLHSTLRAFLEHRGNLTEMADVLEVHPTTVAYRIRRLEERFGDKMSDPEWRFASRIALRAETLGYDYVSASGEEPDLCGHEVPGEELHFGTANSWPDSML